MFALIESCKESGMGKKAFCDQQGLSQAVYYYWQKKYKEATTSVSGGFIPVKCQGIAPTPATGIEIYYPNGVRIHIGDHTELTLVRLLVGLL
jgi:hypothetical protein